MNFIKPFILIVLMITSVLPASAGWGAQTFSTTTSPSSAQSAGIWCSTQSVKRSYGSSSNTAGYSRPYGTNIAAGSTSAMSQAPMTATQLQTRRGMKTSATAISGRSGGYQGRLENRSYNFNTGSPVQVNNSGYSSFAAANLYVPMGGSVTNNGTGPKRVLPTGDNFSGGMAAQEFYNWLYGLGHNGSDAFYDGYDGGDYWYFDESKLRELFEAWIAAHPEFAGLTWDEFMSQWFNTEQNEWFRMPVGNGMWVMMVCVVLYAIIKKWLHTIINKMITE